MGMMGGRVYRGFMTHEGDTYSYLFFFFILPCSMCSLNSFNTRNETLVKSDIAGELSVWPPDIQYKAGFFAVFVLDS